MRVGPQSWNLVSIDTPGVPHTGVWGDPRRFAELGKPYGIKIGWSVPIHAFYAYSETRDGRCFPGLCFWDAGGQPKPVDPMLVYDMAYLMSYHKTHDMWAAVALAQKHQQEAEQEEAEKRYEDMREDVMRRVDERMGFRTPKLYFPVLGVK